MISKKQLPGALFCATLALPAYLLGKQIPVIGGPVFGILIGMIVTMLWTTWNKNKTLDLDSGVKFTSKKLLQLAIILLGFDMNLFLVASVGSLSLAVMIFTLSSAFIMAWFSSKLLKIKGNTAILIGVGTSICGGSAIAATAPVIQANDDDIAHAISTIFLFNVLAVFIFPPLGHLLGMGDIGFGIWAGTAINDTSSVVAAATAWSSAAGNDTALAYATIVKLTRTLMIVPITLALALYVSHKSKKQQNTSYSIVKIFPWFVLGFVLSALLNTIGFIPESIAKTLTQSGKYLIVMAMAAIGLNTHLVKLIKNGIQPILMGLLCWFTVAGVSLLVQSILKLW